MAISWRSVLPLASLLTLSGCDDSGRHVITDPLPVPTSITVSGDSVLSPQETTTFGAEVRDAKGDVYPFEVQWSVSDARLASIDDSGRLSTTGTGSVYVIGEAGPIRDSVQLRITRSYSSISVGESGACALGVDQRIWCWGNPRGTDLVGTIYGPTAVKSDADFAQVNIGVGAACGVTVTYEAYCWGNNAYGHLGTDNAGNPALPGLVLNGFHYSVVEVGWEHACGVTTTNAAICWGRNAHGENGDSTLGTGGVLGQPPAPVSGNHLWLTIAAGRNKTCGLLTDGKAWCWGANPATMAIDSTLGSDVNYPLPVEHSGTYRQIVVGGLHQCALTDAGAAECWGYNAFGQLGNGAWDRTHRPGAVSGGYVFTTLAAGEWHTCGIDVVGDAWCWGINALGHPSQSISNVPVKVQGGHHFVSIGAGDTSTCGVTAGGAVYCWGAGPVGNGQPPAGGIVSVPTRVRDP